MATLVQVKKSGMIYVHHWEPHITRVKISTKIKVDTDDWNTTKQQPKKSSLTYKGMNVKAELTRHLQAMENAVQYLEINKMHSTRARIIERYKFNIDPSNKFKKRPIIISIQDCIKDYMKSKDLTDGTLSVYNRTVNALDDMLKLKIISIDSLDTSFLETFVKYCNSKKLAQNTTKVYLDKIKAVMTWANANGKTINTKYKGFKFKSEKTDSIAFTEDEMQLFINCKVPPKLQDTKDYFIAGYYTALRYSDWHRINLNLVDSDNIFSIRSTKTDSTSYAPVSPTLMKILEKWDANGQPEIATPQTIGYQLRKICKLAGIITKVSVRITKGGKTKHEDKPKHELVTTHTARRSVATNLILRGVSPYVVMKLTGHTNIETFSKYVRFQEIDAKNQLMELSFFK